MAKVMISMPDRLLKEIDRAAKRNHKKRSELLRDLALQFLKGGVEPLPQPGPRWWSEDPFEELEKHKIHLDPGETTEGLIRQMRDSR